MALFAANTVSNGAYFDNATITVVVPEPSTYALFAGCFALVEVMSARRRK
ncbi:MAG: PEP-CTERM sorting domain-containing protein [Verrucomicrobiota bacterium]